MVKVTLEFKSADEAIVALAKLVEAPVVKERTDKADTLAPVPSTTKPTRGRGRPPKKAVGEGNERGNTLATQSAAQPQVGSTVPLPAAPNPPEPVKNPAAEPSQAAQAPAPTGAAKIDDDTVFAVVEKIFDHPKLGVLKAQELLGKFGVVKVREIPADKRQALMDAGNDMLKAAA